MKNPLSSPFLSQFSDFAIVVFFLLMPIQLLSQTLWLQGTISDTEGLALHYVSVGIAGKPIGTVSDQNGHFSLRINPQELAPNDSLRVSMIGYCPQSVAVAPLLRKPESPLLLSLQQQTTTLETITIQAPRSTTKTRGLHSTSALNMLVKFAIDQLDNQNLGAEIGRRFSVSAPNTLLTKFRFYLYENDFDSLVFRINVYELKRGKPDKLLLNRNLYQSVYQGIKGWVTVDLRPFQLIAQRDVAVTVQWVGKSAKGENLSLPLAMPVRGTHYYRYGSQNHWKAYRTMSTLMELEMVY